MTVKPKVVALADTRADVAVPEARLPPAIPLGPVEKINRPDTVADAITTEIKSPPAIVLGKAKESRRRRPAWFSMTAASAAIMVVLPVLFAAIYYFGFASNQYTTPLKFAVRGGIEPGGHDAGALAGLPGPVSAMADAFVVTEFIKSRQAVEDVARDVDLRAIYSRPSVDRFARLKAGATVEELVEYWRSMVTAHFDILTGIVTVDVRAFTSADSLAIANAVVKAADNLLFQMSEKARRDRLRFAEQELGRSETRLRQARNALQDFREQERVLDPAKNAQSQTEGLNRLREELTRLKTELATVINYLSPTAPSVQVLRSRIKATEDEVKRLEKVVGDAAFGPKNDGQAPAQVSRFAELELDQQFAEKAYNAAREQLDRARSAAERRTVYLTVFVAPNLAQGAEYPKPVRSVLVVLLTAGGIWLLAVLMVYGVRDHML